MISVELVETECNVKSSDKKIQNMKKKLKNLKISKKLKKFKN